MPVKFVRRLLGGRFLAIALAWLAFSAASAQATTYALGTNTFLVGPAAGSNSVVLAVTPQTGVWTATANAAWLHLSPANQSGTGSTNVVFSYDANPGATRSGTLTIGDQTLTVTQAGSTYVAAGVTTLASGLYPEGVAVDPTGNVYFTAQEFGSALYEWTATNNTVTALSPPSGHVYFTGVAVCYDSYGSAVFVADVASNVIEMWWDGGWATQLSSGLSNPNGVAVNGPCNIYIADTGDNAIKEFRNPVLTTLVSSGLNSPYGVAVDGAGNVYIADTGNNAIKEWTTAGAVTTLVSSGLNNPLGVAVDSAGNVYIADTGNGAIKEWRAGAVTTLASGLSPEGVAVDGSGNVYIADSGAIKELPCAFVDPTTRLESQDAGNDALPVVLPATENLLAPFAPTSDQSWLTISGVTNGVVSFSFTANTGSSNRTAHISLLGQIIPVTQILNLGITPLAGFTAIGPFGGPFSVTTQNFSLTNTGIASLNWSLINTSSWLNASSSSGTLAIGGQTNVTVSLNSVASNLFAGTYTANVWFTNQTSGFAQSCQFTLQVLEPLVVTPTNGFTATGPFGGPFSVTAQSFSLTNDSGGASLNWSVINTPSWLNASPSSGTLAAGGQTNVTVSLNSVASNSAPGSYTANIWFTNQTSGDAQSCQFTLQVFEPLVITPTNGFTASGTVGGPFSVTAQSFSLTNDSGAASLNWSVINTPSWLNASPTSGTLAVGRQATITVSLNPIVINLAAGTYTASIWFTNRTTGIAQSRQFTLLVEGTIQNGGFETGDFSYWTLSGDTKNVSVYGGLKHSGSYGALLRTPDSLGYGYISQTVLTVAGQSYLLSLWLDSPSNPGSGHQTTPNEFSVVWNGTTLFDQVNIPVIGWTNLQFIVTATASSTVLQFGFLDNPWHLGLDDVSLWPWPIAAPSFQSVTQSGNTIQFSWMGLTGLAYQMQYKTNLLQSSWINLGSIVTATNTTMTIPDVIGSDPQRFYRIQWTPTY